MKRYNIKMRKKILGGSILLLISVLVLFVQYRQIELKREARSNLLASEQNKQHLSGESPAPMEEVDSDLYPDGQEQLAQLEYLKRIDPALGIVPYERLITANKQTDLLLRQRAPISGVSWEERGPNNIAGRTRALMWDPNDMTHKKVWAGGIGGGLWYTDDITATSPVWNKVNDFWNNIAISAIAYNPGNTQELYVGTGEGWRNDNNFQAGSGMWKSSNGGSTWSLLANTDPGSGSIDSDWRYINKIVVKSNGYVFATTKGRTGPYGGIMRSTDGGNTWTKVLSVYPGTYNWGADIEVAANGDLYCSFGVLTFGRVYKSTNANNGALGTWTDLSSNIVLANVERIELACAPSDSNIIYAVARIYNGTANDIGWFKVSIDRGTTWSQIAIPRLVDDGTTHFTRGQGTYDLILAVHPTNPNYVLAGGIDLHRTTNGGTSWTGISHWTGSFGKPYVHADQHMILFRPGDSNQAIFSNDGGVFYSTNAGDGSATPVFSAKNTGYNVTELQTCAVKNTVNNHYFLTGSQDNSTQRFSMPQMNSTVVVIGGDGGYAHIDQLNPSIQLGSIVNNIIYRSLDGGLSFSLILNENTGWFVCPSEYDSQRKIFYSCANSGMLKKISGVDAAFTISDITILAGSAKACALKLSPFNDVLFAGMDNGQIYKLTNPSTGSPTPTRIDNGVTPITNIGWVSSIDVGANDNQILVTYSNYGVISVWETTDGGSHWYNKEGNLPDIPILWILYNPDNRNQVLAATEIGVWSTDNFQPGTSAAPVWGTSNNGLANTRCTMLRYRSADKLVAVSTAGRGLFTSDIFVTTPIADFIVDQSVSCTGSLTAHFSDASLRANNSWAWDIDNNGTTDYTVRNPTHIYTTPGFYSVKLTINAGDTSITKQNFITVPNIGPTPNTECIVPTNSNLGNTGGYGIYRFALRQIDNTTPNNEGSYQNYTCPQFATLGLNTLYNATIQTGTINVSGAKVYLDYNDSGIFETGEAILTFPSNTEGTRTLPFTTPASGVMLNRPLLLRVISRASVPANPCDIGINGQVEDYKVYFCNSDLPTPNTECTVPNNSNLNNDQGYGIYRFVLNQIDNTTPNNDGSYQLYSCPQFSTLYLNTLYNVTIQTGTLNVSSAKVYLDYNNSGVFEAGEAILAFPSNTEGTRTLPFTTPASGVISNRSLLLRVVSRGPVPTTPCDIGSYGQVEDYTVVFPCNLIVTQTSGSAYGSLSAVMNCANSGDTVRIAASLANQTINIGSSAITINKNVVIMALGANTIITGSGTQIFSVSTGKNLELSNVTVIAGTSLTSGAINNNGILKLNNSKILRNPGVSNATLIRNQMGSQMNTFGSCFINN